MWKLLQLCSLLLRHSSCKSGAHDAFERGNVTVDLSCLVCIAFRLNLIIRESFAQKLEHGAYTDMARVRLPASEGMGTFSTLLYVCTGFHVVRQ